MIPTSLHIDVSRLSAARLLHVCTLTSPDMQQFGSCISARRCLQTCSKPVPASLYVDVTRYAATQFLLCLHNDVSRPEASRSLRLWTLTSPDLQLLGSCFSARWPLLTSNYSILVSLYADASRRAATRFLYLYKLMSPDMQQPGSCISAHWRLQTGSCLIPAFLHAVYRQDMQQSGFCISARWCVQEFSTSFPASLQVYVTQPAAVWFLHLCTLMSPDMQQSSSYIFTCWCLQTCSCLIPAINHATVSRNQQHSFRKQNRYTLNNVKKRHFFVKHGRVIPKTQKMVLDAALLSTQHYEVRIKAKVEQPWEWSSTLPYTSM